MGKIKFDFSGECFLVTGASSGIGRNIACQLAESGAIVLALARRQDKLAELEEIYPCHIIGKAVDVCVKEQMEQIINSFVHDTGKFSGVVHAAGISGITPLRSHDEQLSKKIFDVSFWAGTDLMQIVTRKKYTVDGAAMVLFSSIAGESCPRGMFAYNASKAAVNAAVRSIAKEISKRGQRINSIMPGWVETDMTAVLGGMSNLDEIMGKCLLGTGTPADITGMVLFLLSEQARWITGTNIIVDGGFLA